MATSSRAFLPDLLVAGGRVWAGAALSVVDGRVAGVGEPAAGCAPVRLAGKALIPGLVSAHSHAFQRVIRGRTQVRPPGRSDFWAWREAMYHAAARLDPDDLHVAARMAFHEMARAGITAVGEFAYLHRDPAGRSYEEPDLLHRQVIRAAREVGLRVVLLRSAYARGGAWKEPDPTQRRFLDGSPEEVVESAVRLAQHAAGDPGVAVGLAPHSVRACPAEWIGLLAGEARRRGWPLHVHASEQPAEVEQCRAEHGASPVELLDRVGALQGGTTLVHAVHVDAGDVALAGRARAIVCACPTTERDLGDGIVPAGDLLRAGARLALGTDSNVVIDPLEEARVLEGHLRLRHLERGVLAPDGDGRTDALALRLLDVATAGGARSLGLPGGDLAPGSPADFVVLDLDDPSVAGASADDLAAQVVFSAARTAVRDVYVAGEAIVTDGTSATGRPAAEDVVGEFRRTMARLWGG